MSGSGVHPYEMPFPELPEDDLSPSMQHFVDDVRMVAGGPPPVPRAALATLLEEGIATWPAPQADRRTPRRNPRMLWKPILVGLGATLASVGVAGATGVLPEPADRAVEAVVRAATPFEIGDRADDAQELAEDLVKDVTDDLDDVQGEVDVDVTVDPTTPTLPGDAADEGDGEGQGDGESRDNHGACVSEAAHDRSGPGNHGAAVSAVARSDCGKKDRTTDTTVGSTSTTLDDQEESDDTESSNRGPGNGRGRGNGNGSGNGRGNSGPGGS